MQLMHLMVKLREVRDVLRVGLQDIRRLQTLDAVLVDIGQLVLEEERIDPFILVVGTNGDEQEAEGVHLLGLERLKQMIPSERQ